MPAAFWSESAAFFCIGAMSDTRRGKHGDFDALRAEGVADAEGPGAGVEEPVAGAVEPSGRPPLFAVLEAVQSQVPQSAVRDRVLDAGRDLASTAKKKAAGERTCWECPIVV